MSRINCQGLIQFSSIGSLYVCGTFAASVFPTVVKYVLQLFAMSALSVQGIPLDVINVSVTAVFLFLFFSIWPIVSHVFPPLFLCMSYFSLKYFFFAILIMWVSLLLNVLYVISFSCVGVFFSF